MSMISGASGIAGGVADGQAGAAQRGFSSLVARENARTTAGQATMREGAQRREAAQMQGAQLAAIGESGTGFGGSNGLIAAQDAALAELDILTDRYEGRLKTIEYDNQADLLGVQQTTGMQRVFGKRGLGQFSNMFTLWEPLLTGRSGDKSRGW